MRKDPCFVVEIDITLAPKMKGDLDSQGFTLTQPPYTFFQAKKKGVSCTLYQSGKLTVQGKDKEEFINYYLEPEILKTFTYSYPKVNIDLTPRIGVDEAGKGDVFGPLCICSIYADKKGIETLIDWGIRDSKKMGDPAILEYAKKLRAHYPYTLIALFPSKYNELYEKFNNLNRLLAWGHATAICELVQKTGCHEVIIDQFAKEEVVEAAIRQKKCIVNLTQRFKGEEDVVVAASSIIARAAFVEGIEKLGNEYNIILPKGASKAVVEVGKTFVGRYGKDSLNKVSKLHFKTIKEML